MLNFKDYIKLANEMINESDDIISGVDDNNMLDFNELITNYYNLYHQYKGTEHSGKIIELKNLINSSIQNHKDAKEKCENYLNGNF